MSGLRRMTGCEARSNSSVGGLISNLNTLMMLFNVMLR